MQINEFVVQPCRVCSSAKIEYIHPIVSLEDLLIRFYQRLFPSNDLERRYRQLPFECIMNFHVVEADIFSHYKDKKFVQQSRAVYCGFLNCMIISHLNCLIHQSRSLTFSAHFNLY